MRASSGVMRAFSGVVWQPAKASNNKASTLRTTIFPLARRIGLRRYGRSLFCAIACGVAYCDSSWFPVLVGLTVMVLLILPPVKPFQPSATSLLPLLGARSGWMLHIHSWSLLEAHLPGKRGKGQGQPSTDAPWRDREADFKIILDIMFIVRRIHNDLRINKLCPTQGAFQLNS
ncbi:MAG: hypothetical protein LBI02_10005 [Opitutaceae bacterium]|jgi:hypothetical protein|nr:hypothetical protein [Opitutaceae bacterium]